MTDHLRVLTYNLLTLGVASGRERHEVVRRLLPDLRVDVVALQEVTRSPDFDQGLDLLGHEFAIVDLPGWTSDHVGDRPIMMGGCWLDPPGHGLPGLRPMADPNGPPTPYIGFRCARDA